MKSKQLNFYSVVEDLPFMNTYFKEQNIVVIRLPLLDKNKIISDCALNNKISSGEWSKVYLTRRDFMKELKFNYISEQNYFLVDDLASPVIEFMRPLPDINSGLIDRSRLYFVTSYYYNNLLVYKDEEFIFWANNIFLGFKKSFLKKVKEKNNILITNEFEKLINDGKIDLQFYSKSYFKVSRL